MAVGKKFQPPFRSLVPLASLSGDEKDTSFLPKSTPQCREMSLSYVEAKTDGTQPPPLQSAVQQSTISRGRKLKNWKTAKNKFATPPFGSKKSTLLPFNDEINFVAEYRSSENTIFLIRKMAVGKKFQLPVRSRVPLALLSGDEKDTAILP